MPQARGLLHKKSTAPKGGASLLFWLTPSPASVTTVFVEQGRDLVIWKVDAQGAAAVKTDDSGERRPLRVQDAALRLRVKILLILEFSAKVDVDLLPDPLKFRDKGHSTGVASNDVEELWMLETKSDMIPTLFTVSMTSSHKALIYHRLPGNEAGHL